MARKTIAQRAQESLEESHRLALLHEEFQKDLPRKIIFELIPELHERGIHYQINYGTLEPFQTDKQTMLNVDGNWFTILEIADWQWEGEIMGIIRDFDYKRKIAQEKEAKRTTALNKLTAEERQILGIK